MGTDDTEALIAPVLQPLRPSTLPKCQEQSDFSLASDLSLIQFWSDLELSVVRSPGQTLAYCAH